MSDWPQKIETLDALPKRIRMALEPYMKERWFYCIYVPENHRGHHVHPAYTMTLLDQGLHIAFEHIENIEVHIISYGDVLYLEKGVVFLRGWLMFSGLYDSQFKTHKFLFNAVRDELFDPIIERIRKENHGHLKLNITKNKKETFAFLAQENLKLYNYSYQIFRNEKPMLSIYQPEITEKLLHVFKNTQIPSRVLHMTDKELILIQEPKRVGNSLYARGGIWQYIPLNKIDHVRLDHNQGSEVTHMHIHLINNDQLTLDFSESKEIELYKITTELDYLKNAR